MNALIAKLPKHSIWIIVLFLAMTFLFIRSGFDFNYLIPKRVNRLATMIDHKFNI